ncbi:MAG: TetR family transcriptional regulator [Microbacterium sp.]|uniref:TetR family transcriptional regulator n=1 Tax=Microbacterium sp. TaxID=51671 RepID=UPI0039E42439
MVSRESPRARRKPPGERRAEITAAAAAVALSAGLERVTLRVVAGELDVRPGLIHHYFPAADDLVAAAFALAVSGERRRILTADGSPLRRLAHLASSVQDERGHELARLWLNARHLARFNASLAEALEEQEALDRDQLTQLIEDGVRDGTFHTDDPFAACVRIFVAIDGFGAYANNTQPFMHLSFTNFVTDVAEWSLGLDAGSLRAALEGGAEPPGAVHDRT